MLSGINGLKLLLVMSAVLLNYAFYAKRIAEIDGLAMTVVYLGLFGFCLLAVVGAAFIRRAGVRWFWALLFFAAGVAQDANMRVMDNFLTYDSFVLMAHSVGFADAALRQYLGQILVSVPASLLLSLAIVLPPKYESGGSVAKNGILMAAPVSVIIVLTGILFARGGMGSNGLPAPLVVPSLATLYAVDLMANDHGPRQAVSIPLATDRNTGPEDVVLVVDESVRGDYLDINHPAGIASGLSSAPPGAQLWNLGVAASATNCSVGSNVIMRFGGTRANYRKNVQTQPSIWAYAGEAGFETIYIDAQSEYKFFNGMDDAEIQQIDRIIQFKDVPPRDRDVASAEILAGLLGDGKRQLILVNKLGGHFPVHDKYPDDYLVYEPVLARGVLDDSKPIIKSVFGNEAVDWERYKNSYRNTLLWSVGHYFERLFAKADFSRTVMIYTSDHGQNFHERGEPGSYTHCSSGKRPSMEEGAVPLVLVLGHGAGITYSLDLQVKLKDATSHYAVFPTLLRALGYEVEPVRQMYGDSLLHHHHDPMTFNSRFEARLGQKPVWQKVTPGLVKGPPAG